MGWLVSQRFSTLTVVSSATASSTAPPAKASAAERRATGPRGGAGSAAAVTRGGACSAPSFTRGGSGDGLAVLGHQLLRLGQQHGAVEAALPRLRDPGIDHGL